MAYLGNLSQGAVHHEFRRAVRLFRLWLRLKLFVHFPSPFSLLYFINNTACTKNLFFTFTDLGLDAMAAKPKCQLCGRPNHIRIGWTLSGQIPPIGFDYRAKIHKSL